jgi:secretion/DNA translocation related TadE-like protein
MTGVPVRRRARPGVRRRRTDDRDRGSATIWAVGGIAALLVVAVVLLELGAATVVRHRAGSAADLAALAAAAYAPDGQQAACDRARWVADGMRVRLTACRLVGWDALVEVSAQPDGLLARFGPVAAHARAGPADEPP